MSVHRIKEPASRVSPDSHHLIEWLTGDECHDLDDRGFVAGIGRHLRNSGLPVDRLTLHLRTLHPELLGRTVAWSPGSAVEIYDREHGLEASAAFTRSPVRQVMDSRRWLTVSAGDASFPGWAQLDVFRNQEMAQLVIAPLVSHDGPASAAVFGTRRPTGFSNAERRALTSIVPALRGACELRLLRHAAATLLDTYVGTATSRRILAGHVRRGDVETLEAALFLYDLRGFTALSDRLPGSEVLALLNVYFDQIVPAVAAAGGEILKFMGDAVLAYFHRDGDAAGSCAAAFDAARIALARLAEASARAGVELHAGVSLHYGEVSYGNIGSGHRLDFTAIGRDVNLTSRLQGLCEVTGQSLLMSQRFAEMLAAPGAVSLGGYRVKGLADPLEVFIPASGRMKDL
jgi:adenylate cyclase